MLKKLIPLLAVVTILMAAPIGAAFADTVSDNQIVYQQALCGYYIIWQTPSGQWKTIINGKVADTEPGDDVSFTKPYDVPASIKEKYNTTGAEVTAVVNHELYDACYNCGGGHYGLGINEHTIDNWEDFRDDFIVYQPSSISATIADHQYSQGHVDVQWNMILSPEWKAYDLTNYDTRQLLGLDNSEYESYLKNAEKGYQWMAPAVLTWYGIPKDTGLDLAVTSLDSGVPSGEKVKPGRQYTGTVVYENLSGITMTKPAAVKVSHQGYETTLKDEAGNAVSTLTLAPGESKTLTYTWHGPTDASTSTIKAIINLPPDEALPEADITNNEKTITIGVELQNLKVQITSIPSESPNAGASVTVKGLATNESASPITTLIQWYLDNKKVYEGNVTIDKTRNLTFPFVMPNKDTLVTVQVNPGHNMPPNETTWEDNKDKATINVNALKPVVNGNLQLTARSQGGDDVFGNYIPPQDREPGKAKWGDIVTAKLTTREAPDLGSCYNLKTWKLESATIYFPKQHPDFTFDSPFEPVGTESKQMSITGNRTATVQFRENWSLNGAEIYDMLKEEMIPGPTDYNVKVTYKMLWEYSKGHRACCGEEKCNPCCKDWKDYTKHPTYTVKTQLLVDGTGVQPFAN